VGYHAVGDANGGIAYGVDGYVGVARGSDEGCSIDGSGSVNNDSEAAENRAFEGENGGVAVAHVADGAASEALMVGIGVAFGWGGIQADGGGEEGACDGGEHGGCGCEGDKGDGADGGEDQIVLGCELIAQSTLRSRGNRGGGSVCDDERHSSGVGNDCRDGGDDSGGQSQKMSSDGGFDGNGCVGASRDSVDGSGSADDASESTRNHTVEGANLMMQLKAW